MTRHKCRSSWWKFLSQVPQAEGPNRNFPNEHSLRRFTSDRCQWKISEPTFLDGSSWAKDYERKIPMRRLYARNPDGKFENAIPTQNESPKEVQKRNFQRGGSSQTRIFKRSFPHEDSNDESVILKVNRRKIPNEGHQATCTKEKTEAMHFVLNSMW